MSDESIEARAGIGRIALKFLLRFLAASIPLYLLYAVAGIHYTRLVASLAKPLFMLSDIELVVERALTVTEEISLNPVVFLSLVIATPRIGALRKVRAGLTGFVILTLANSVTLYMIFLSAARGSERLWSGTEFLNLTINFFLPLLLWVLLLPVISIASRLREPPDHG